MLIDSPIKTLCTLRDDFLKSRKDMLEVKKLNIKIIKIKTLYYLYDIKRSLEFVMTSDEETKEIVKKLQTLILDASVRIQLCNDAGEIFNYLENSFLNDFAGISSGSFINDEIHRALYSENSDCDYPNVYIAELLLMLFKDISIHSSEKINLFGYFDTTWNKMHTEDFFDGVTSFYYKTFPHNNIRSYFQVVKHDNMEKFVTLENCLEYNNSGKVLYADSADIRVGTNFDVSITSYNNRDFGELKMELANSFKFFLNRCHYHTKDNGLIIVNVPKACITEEIISKLVRSIKDINVYQKDSEVFFVGKKKLPVQADIEEEMDLLLKLFTDNEQKSRGNKFSIFKQQDTNVIFRYNAVSEEDIISALKTSSAQRELKHLQKEIAKDIFVENENNKLRPIINFNPGQLGLILVSGAINGVVDEGNGFCHLIKGGSLKMPETVINNIDELNYNRETTYRSKTFVTVLTADGIFKTLR